MIDEMQGQVVPVKLWTRVAEVEPQAQDQLKNIASLPWAFHHVAVMPDVHYGKGATVGSVVAMRDAVSPAAVGVDIGCGMASVRTNLKAKKLPDTGTEKIRRVREAIEATIPVGFNQHDQASWGDCSENLAVEVKTLMERFGDLSSEVQDLAGKAALQIGTLGGGNHFVELCVDSGKCHCEGGSVDTRIGFVKCEDCGGRGKREPLVWLMLHSGSRNIGKTLADVHITRARALAHNAELPDRDLSVFLAGTPEMTAYRHDLYWAQEYARLNRAVMLERYVRALQDFWPSLSSEEAVHCHHNYVAEEMHFGERVFVTRKGAIRAGRGEMGIIPGSMGTKSYIVRGLGNAESYESASHGAGRRMSRGQAKKRFTRADLEAQTAGVECRKDAGVLDEIPKAYKDIDKVMENQRDLVEIVAELKQVVCVKG